MRPQVTSQQFYIDADTLAGDGSVFNPIRAVGSSNAAQLAWLHNMMVCQAMLPEALRGGNAQRYNAAPPPDSFQVGFLGVQLGGGTNNDVAPDPDPGSEQMPVVVQAMLAWSITGFDTTWAGVMPLPAPYASAHQVIVINCTAQSGTLVNESALSVAANRLALPNGADIVIPPAAMIALAYNDDDSRWNLHPLCVLP